MFNYHTASLRKAGFKITPQRLAVINYVNDHTPGHFTAEQAFQAVRKREPTITLATTYNILYALKAAGTLKSFESRNTTWFESRTDFHANFVCTNCNNIYDLEIEEQKILSLLYKDGFEIEDMDLILRGTCPKCRGIPKADAVRVEQ